MALVNIVLRHAFILDKFDLCLLILLLRILEPVWEFQGAA